MEFQTLCKKLEFSQEQMLTKENKTLQNTTSTLTSQLSSVTKEKERHDRGNSRCTILIKEFMATKLNWVQATVHQNINIKKVFKHQP